MTKTTRPRIDLTKEQAPLWSERPVPGVSLDDLFNEVEAENAAKPAPAPTPPEELDRRLTEYQRQLDEAPPEVEDDEDEEEA